jgi:small-conductance mechanosensitive channel
MSDEPQPQEQQQEQQPPRRSYRPISESARVRQMLQTRSHSWREVGLARELSRKAVKRARIQLAVLLPLLAAVLLMYAYRDELFGRSLDTPVRVLTVVALMILGWQFARDIGRSAGPMLFRRLDPGTAGTVGFLIRLTTILVAFLVAARIAGLDPRTLAVGGAFTAVVVGLAAQQTLGNLIAGTVLLSARPFRVGDRVRLQGGGLAGTVEGVVASLGLLYTTFASGDDLILVPNSVVLSVAIVPLREPDGVDLRARLRPGVTPEDIKRLLSEALETPIRGEPHVALEELDGDEVVVRIQAVPEHAEDGSRLAGEVLSTVARETARAGA